MKKTINIKLAFVLLIAAVLGSCQKKLDINQNPNLPEDAVVTAELILPNALHATGVQTALGYGWLSNWMGYWSASGSFNPSTEESSYNITNTFQEGKWSGIYNTLFDLQKVDEKASAAGQTFYRAISMIMKAHLYQNLVDIYGNVIYSQAFQPTVYPTPEYDDAAKIYEDLHVKLDSAIGLMKSASVSNKAKEIDIVYGGNTTLWIKLANTIKLRLLIRASKVEANPTAELAKIKANGGVLQSGETADVNPGYRNDNNRQSPFYAVYGLLVSGEDANTFFRANAYAIDYLEGNADARLGYFFKPAKSPTSASHPYVGTVYGGEPNSAFGGDQTSNVGMGLVRSAEQPQWIVTSMESMFLQAEAILKGWDVGGPYAGNAQDAYEAAVTESFLWLQVPNAATEADDYMQNVADWASAVDDAERLELIIWQKYIALTGINPLEAWNDYRRTGFPGDVPLSINNARGNRKIPVRLLYPSIEYAVNAGNVAKQGTINTQTSTLFWDK
ncbi:SusD/RagB family nutrient-binding outer membrane lipoprotein [Niastella populi]|uniref:SusD/RagB family nutrient-binding outer membrane lipoprotein n=1 Tax=Niastella populi TaxID=550983 RepID=A0A1V9G857_9BACT|nr:SusD/RagB family nutrient-binding outer membrane lipoprotein [Niastella populi]OQP66750.1 hypothetical protein A4R26_13345 [Niastella populi]